MAKTPDKFIRLPVHLACKTCPRGQVVCYLELSPEYPKGDLHRRCATCLSAHCGFVKMDIHARAELRTWLDQELGRRKSLAQANPQVGRAAIDEIIDVEGAGTATVGRGGRTKRNQTMYVNSDSEDNENDMSRPTTRSRPAAGVATAPVVTGPAFESDFVQQAIKLVTSSQTVEQQLADMQKDIVAAAKAQAEAEQTIRCVKEEKKTAEKERDEALEREGALKIKLDNVKQTTEADELAKAKAERRQTLSEDTAKRLRRERDAIKEQLEAANQATELAEGGRRIADEGRDILQGELDEERADHAVTAKEVVKWKNAVANLLK
jgi:hypothetical protein